MSSRKFLCLSATSCNREESKFQDNKIQNLYDNYRKKTRPNYDEKSASNANINIDNNNNTKNDDDKRRQKKSKIKSTRRTNRLVIFGCVGLSAWLLGKYYILEDTEKSVSHLIDETNKKLNK